MSFDPFTLVAEIFSDGKRSSCLRFSSSPWVTCFAGLRRPRCSYTSSAQLPALAVEGEHPSPFDAHAARSPFPFRQYWHPLHDRHVRRDESARTRKVAGVHRRLRSPRFCRRQSNLYLNQPARSLTSLGSLRRRCVGATSVLALRILAAGPMHRNFGHHHISLYPVRISSSACPAPQTLTRMQIKSSLWKLP